ncbi:MAG: hypothetical protein JRF04_01120 [Deltaproteobacteria bacterium]|nr:hypothetical protein [Deltaproteobacteria bacterium]
MQKHIRIISIIMIVMGVFYLVVVVLLGLTGLMAAKNQAQTGEVAMLPAILTGVTFLLPMALFGVLHIMTGRAFRAGANWARIGLWILAIINLGNVPVGTAIGAYAIWILVKTREDVKTIH